MGDCRKYLLFPGWIAFLAGRTQADYLVLRVYLERLIATTSFLSFVLKTAGAQFQRNPSSAL